MAYLKSIRVLEFQERYNWKYRYKIEIVLNIIYQNILCFISNSIVLSALSELIHLLLSVLLILEGLLLYIEKKKRKKFVSTK